MNYGYAEKTESGHTIVLSNEEEAERFCYQLYHYMGTGLRKFPKLSRLTIVDVGCGRGGGISFLCKSLNPALAIGVDYCKRNIDFCNNNYSLGHLDFRCGHAENLPIESDSVNMILSIESVTEYYDLRKFLQEVDRVLKVGGHLLIADIIVSQHINAFEQSLASTGYDMEKEDITENVLSAVKLEDKRRIEFIDQSVPRLYKGLLKKFTMMENSTLCQQLLSQECRFLAYKLSKTK